MQIEHMAIWTHDLERMKAFYIRHFNMTASAVYHNPQKRFYSCFLTFNHGVRLEIMKKEGIPEGISSETTGYAHMAFAVGSQKEVDALTTRLENAGVRVISKPRLTGDGYYESVILDCDGNEIELTAVNERISEQ